ncbi:MAG TPA: diacylglycerol kinase family protein, partial [Terriglobales bacterium]|nr:diacylglycerol kinase family protein [Terriglobales bacterium]
YGEAGEQAREAIASGCDTVFACGGDGTIHDVLQGMVGTPAALAIIPLGTANSLAHDLKLPRNAAAAARVALAGKARRIALGRVQYLDFKGNPASRHFIVAVGIGVDAHLFYKLNVGVKQHLGMLAYYVKATHLWLTHRMEHFIAEYMETGSGEQKQSVVSELLAVRIRNFGGILQELAPGASLEREDMRLVLFYTSNRVLYLAYVLRGLLKRNWRVPGINLLNSVKVACRAEPSTQQGRVNRRVYVEADGELVGTIPAEISMVPDALNLIMP